MEETDPPCNLTSIGRERERKTERIKALEKDLLRAVLAATHLPPAVVAAREAILKEFEQLNLSSKKA